MQTEKFAYEGSRLSSWETQGGVKGQYTWGESGWNMLYLPVWEVMKSAIATIAKDW